MRTWAGIASAFLVVIGLHSAAWANSELHPGGRLFFPLWDVSTPNRLTMIVVTRQAMRDGSSIFPVGKAFQIQGTPGKCLPRGALGSTVNVNRTDLGGTSTNPVFVDDVRFEYYGSSCTSDHEVVHMSCADIDVFLLASSDNADDLRPRRAFETVAGDGRGALDVHLVTNGTTDPKFRKLENSLMGHAIISDLAEGWVANYDAASAKAGNCTFCDDIDSGTPVGYENYPMEVYLPFALADPFPTAGGDLRNILSLWGPTLLAGKSLSGILIDMEFVWWDGRERGFISSRIGHSIIRPLGGATITGLDFPLDGLFNSANFVCGHAPAGNAENDGFPRSGSSATACGVADVADTTHPSDNFENSGDLTTAGHSIQPSTPIGWWRFRLKRDFLPPAPLTFPFHDHSGRGLVGVVLSSAPGQGQSGGGVGFATRLWHEDPCELAQSRITVGPPHERDRLLMGGDNVTLFNISTRAGQREKCALLKPPPELPPGFGLPPGPPFFIPPPFGP